VFFPDLRVNQYSPCFWKQNGHKNITGEFGTQHL